MEGENADLEHRSSCRFGLMAGAFDLVMPPSYRSSALGSWPKKSHGKLGSIGLTGLFVPMFPKPLGITGIGPIGVKSDPALRRTQRGVLPREALSDAHKKVLLLRAP